MHRNQSRMVESWLAAQHPKPYVIRGARQVGKSTLVRLVAKQQNRRLVEVNLERFPLLSRSFATNDPRQILREIEALPSVGAVTRDAILFLDEIQAVPEAIPALRYLHEDIPELPIVSAGSLLEFVLADHEFSMPVGRIQYLHMGPMTFTEYLDAIGEVRLKNEIDTYVLGAPIGPVVHSRLLELLRDYYFVGGMPEAVKTFADTRKFVEVSAIHNAIIDTYRDDFPKYASARNLSRMLNVFNFAARNSGIKIKYSNISRDDHSATIKRDIELLCMARVLTKVTHTHASGLPLQADLEDKTYKLLFLDIGLMNAICGLSWNTLSTLNDIQLVNEGTIAEQFIGQHLQMHLATSANRELTYWLREGRTNNAEVDFVVALHGKVVPIEVKAGQRGSLRSLHQFVGEKSATLAVRFDSNPPDLQRVETTVRTATRDIPTAYELLSLPLYLVERLADLVEQAAVERGA